MYNFKTLKLICIASYRQLVHRGSKLEKKINITKYVPKFLIYGPKMLDKCVKSQKKILHIALFCKVKLSKMASIKTNKIKKSTALFYSNFSRYLYNFASVPAKIPQL